MKTFLPAAIINPPSIVNSIEYFIIATAGNGVDFGDLTSADYNGYDSVSSGHGGL